MFIPGIRFGRHVLQVRRVFSLCLIVTFCTFLLSCIPIITYFDQLQDHDMLASVSTKDELELPQVASRDALQKLKPWNTSKYPPMFVTWQQNRLNGCDGRMEVYSRQFARLWNVIVDRKFCVARAQGGEEVSKVLLQDENAEYYRKIRDCFQLECNDSKSVRYHFYVSRWRADDWLVKMKTADVQTDNVTIDESFSIALERREYANLYHTMNDWYNIFLVMVFFEKRPNETNIVLVDAHPKGKLDPVWSVLFNSTRMLSELSPRTLFTTMIWGMDGRNSILKKPFQFDEASPLLLEEFRMFFLDRFQLNATKQLNCSNVSVLFIWRHDYLAHPRNPLGLVKRKIDNEEELISSLRGRHPNYVFRGVQIDAFEMRDQLRLVTETDILIGMHGAGLSHTLFLPPHGGMIELVPKYDKSYNDHFVDLCFRRGLALARNFNKDPANEMGNYRTRIPVDMIDRLFKMLVVQMCTESQETRLERYHLLRQSGLQREKARAESRRRRMEADAVPHWDAGPMDEDLYRRLFPLEALDMDRFNARLL